jgi:hypothetical protein
MFDLYVELEFVWLYITCNYFKFRILSDKVQGFKILHLGFSFAIGYWEIKIMFV